MLAVLVSLLLTAGPAVSEEAAPDCHLPAGSPGLCVPLAQCSHLTSLLANLQKPLPKDVALIIRESFFCGRLGGKVSVCCPPAGVLPPVPPPPSSQARQHCELQQALPAQCVLYSQCSPFVEMMANLRKPLPPSTSPLIKSSFLCGATEEKGRKYPNICCPAAALSPEEPEEEEEEEPELATRIHRYSDHPALSLLADEKFCGVSATAGRIVGGQDAELGEFPWLVNLGYSQRGRTKYKCGGILIGARWVLTAAHCVTQLPRSYKATTIRLGEHDLDREGECNTDNTLCSHHQDIDIDQIVFHQNYSKPKPFQNDIAVIKLARDVVIDDTVSPVCLPYYDDEEDYEGDGEKNISTAVAGWGATTGTGRNPANILQYLDVAVTDADDCRDIYAQRGGVLTGSQICAGGEAGRDSCVGDSGSGLMRDIVTGSSPFYRSHLIGVVSFGPRLCGTKGVPGVYTRVNSYLTWILDTVESLK